MDTCRALIKHNRNIYNGEKRPKKEKSVKIHKCSIINLEKCALFKHNRNIYNGEKRRKKKKSVKIHKCSIINLEKCLHFSISNTLYLLQNLKK